MASQIHDWKEREFGNDYIYRPNADGTKADMTGWRLGLRAGDVLALYHSDGRRAAYVIDEVKYYGNPLDMFNAKVHFEAGLLAEVDGVLVLTREVSRG